MTYSLARGLFVEYGPAAQAAVVAASRPSGRFLPWRRLDSSRRLELVEEALNAPANDVIDGYPLAL